jgi:uncharacterized protein (DUF983 family)
MKINAPTKSTFVIALIITIVGVVGKIVGMIVPVDFLNDYSLWAAIAGYIILMLGNTLKDFNKTKGLVVTAKKTDTSSRQLVFVTIKTCSL